METIKLDIEKSNELLFRVTVEGLTPTTTIVRLVCEGTDGVSTMFLGKAVDDVVQFELPPLKGRLSEGTYASRVEVLIEDRYFKPIQFEIDLCQPVKVMAEAVQVKPKQGPVNVTVQRVTLKDRYLAKKQ